MAETFMQEYPDMKMKIFAAAALMAAAASPAMAIEQGDWLVRVGVGHVSPNDSSSALDVGVESDTRPTINLTYMVTDNIGVDILGALPFEHDITSGGTKIGSTKHLPPTVGVQYHFMPKSNIRPYVGVGLNYTHFWDETPTAVITSLELDDSFGVAGQVGVDVDLNKDWFVNADVRYIKIGTDATTDLGVVNVDIDPWVFVLGVGTTF